ncbi:MAG: hypothetical protein DI589_22845 [Shinella sp.]|nr:MAG: hypothetical protein DI589_22845 [Shinella sp.]
MKEIIPDGVMRWAGPLIITCVGMFFIVGNPIGQDLFCDGTQNCLATWVGALSGWAAALAAAITIRSLFQQAQAAQMQTDFQLGDAEPTLDAVQHREQKGAIVLQIRNWNRRSMIVRRVRLLTEERISVLVIHFERKTIGPEAALDWTFTTGSSKKFDPALIIEGWVGRDKEPPLLKMSVAARISKDKDTEITDEWRKIPIEVQYELVGIRRVSRLTAHVHLTAKSAIDEDMLPYSFPEQFS